MTPKARNYPSPNGRGARARTSGLAGSIRLLRDRKAPSGHSSAGAPPAAGPGWKCHKSLPRIASAAGRARVGASLPRAPARSGRTPRRQPAGYSAWQIPQPAPQSRSWPGKRLLRRGWLQPSRPVARRPGRFRSSEAAPLPPRNFSRTGQLWPSITHVAVMYTTHQGRPIRAGSATAIAPFPASISSTGRAHHGPSSRKVFSVPALLLPTLRISTCLIYRTR